MRPRRGCSHRGCSRRRNDLKQEQPRRGGGPVATRTTEDSVLVAIDRSEVAVRRTVDRNRAYLVPEKSWCATDHLRTSKGAAGRSTKSSPLTSTSSGCGICCLFLRGGFPSFGDRNGSRLSTFHPCSRISLSLSRLAATPSRTFPAAIGAANF